MQKQTEQIRQEEKSTGTFAYAIPYTILKCVFFFKDPMTIHHNLYMYKLNTMLSTVITDKTYK